MIAAVQKKNDKKKNMRAYIIRLLDIHVNIREKTNARKSGI